MSIKYMGSKNRIAKYIVPIIQNYIDTNNIDTYIEPFCGGANIIDKIKCKNKIGSDINKYLIALLNYAKDPNNIFPDEINRETYNSVRNSYNKNLSLYKDEYVGIVGFLASYNGRFFDGGYAKSGYEKTKNGLRYRNYYQEALNNLVKQSENLKDCIFKCCDYLEYKDKNIKKSVIYLDPHIKILNNSKIQKILTMKIFGISQGICQKKIFVLLVN